MQKNPIFYITIQSLLTTLVITVIIIITNLGQDSLKFFGFIISMGYVVCQYIRIAHETYKEGYYFSDINDKDNIITYKNVKCDNFPIEKFKKRLKKKKNK